MRCRSQSHYHLSPGLEVTSQCYRPQIVLPIVSASAEKETSFVILEFVGHSMMLLVDSKQTKASATSQKTYFNFWNSSLQYIVMATSVMAF